MTPCWPSLVTRLGALQKKIYAHIKSLYFLPLKGQFCAYAPHDPDSSLEFLSKFWFFCLIWFSSWLRPADAVYLKCKFIFFFTPIVSSFSLIGMLLDIPSGSKAHPWNRAAWSLATICQPFSFFVLIGVWHSCQWYLLTLTKTSTKTVSNDENLVGYVFKNLVPMLMVGHFDHYGPGRRGGSLWKPVSRSRPELNGS